MCDWEDYDDGWRICENCNDGYTEFYDSPPETGHISCKDWCEECDQECLDLLEEPLCGSCFEEVLGWVLKKECFNPDRYTRKEWRDIHHKIAYGGLV